MVQYSFLPTEDNFRQGVSALTDLGQIQLGFFRGLAERQTDCIAGWWQQHLKRASALVAATDPTKVMDAMTQAGTDELAFLQTQASRNMELFKSTGESMADWYQKHWSATVPAPTPIRAAPARTKAA